MFSPGRKNGSFIIDGKSRKECPFSNRVWNSFQIEEFGTGVFTTRVYMDAVFEYTMDCDGSILGAAVNGKKSAHGSPTFWMGSHEVNGTWMIHTLETLDYKECEWPLTHTIGTSVEESDMFMPRSIGGPVSSHNHIPGYKVQTNGPWMQVPLEVKRKLAQEPVWLLTEAVMGVGSRPDRPLTAGRSFLNGVAAHAQCHQ